MEKKQNILSSERIYDSIFKSNMKRARLFIFILFGLVSCFSGLKKTGSMTDQDVLIEGKIYTPPSIMSNLK
jgi:hypothetical protein